MTWVRRPLPAALAVLAFLLSVACEESGPRSDLAFTYACAKGEPDCITESRPSHCLAAFVFVTGQDGERQQVPLFDPELGYAVDAGFGEYRAMGGDPFAFDVNRVVEGEEEVTLEFRLYPDTNQQPILGATVEGVTLELLGGEPLSVRLYPIGRWADPGEGDPAPRAFHTAVPLSNGDVLFFGGVHDTQLNVVMGQTAELVTEVDLYDASAHRFLRVEVDPDVDDSAYRRVLFATRYLGFSGGQHRIRVLGGVTAAENRPALAFGPRGNEVGNPGASPVFPADGANRAENFDLLLDTSDPSVPRIVASEPVTNSGEPLGSFLTATEPQPSAQDASGVVFPQLIEGGGAWELGSQAYQLDEAGDVRGTAYALGHQRIGASVTTLAGGATLVWGGNFAMGVEDPDVAAGEIHTGGTANLSPFTGAASPTSFHRARSFGSDLVLTVGGFEVRSQGAAGPTAAYTDAPAAPIRLIEVEPSGALSVRAALPPAGYVSSMFHTLTRLGDQRFLVTGGGTRSADGFSRFVSSDQAGVVTGVGYEPLGDTLTEARLGHTATRLPGNRILVLGGFDGNAAGTILNERSTPAPEMLYLVEVADSDLLQAGQCQPLLNRRDAGAPMDASLPPRGDAGFDAGALPDAGPPLPMDAGMPMMDAG